MMSVLVISPHFDDAILSAGQFIAGRSDVTVLTVFSDVPDESVKSDYDLACGFKNSKEAMEARRWEDGQATALLGAEWLHLGRLDYQYSDGDYKALAPELMVAIVSGEGQHEMILAPLGLRHPDHIALSDAIQKLNLKNLYLYEDLPARVTHPELVTERLKNIPHAKLTFIGDGPMEQKIRALMCYKSQIGRGDLNPYNLYVPERFWKV
jgi:LmbE family N-acetylglucosaminyl deacetylase